MPAPCSNVEKIKKRRPVRMTDHWYAVNSSFSSTKGFFGGSQLCIYFFHNLVHALPRQIKRICNLAKSHTLAAQCKNFNISVVICSGPWLQWSPLPSSNLVKGVNICGRQLVVLRSLADITHPSPDSDFSAVYNFNMNSGHKSVTLPFNKLSNGF